MHVANMSYRIFSYSNNVPLFLIINLFGSFQEINKKIQNNRYDMWRDTDGNHVTSLLHCHWLKFWWRNTDYTRLWFFAYIFC